MVQPDPVHSSKNVVPVDRRSEGWCVPANITAQAAVNVPAAGPAILRRSCCSRLQGSDAMRQGNSGAALRHQHLTPTNGSLSPAHLPDLAASHDAVLVSSARAVCWTAGLHQAVRQ